MVILSHLNHSTYIDRVLVWPNQIQMTHVHHYILY